MTIDEFFFGGVFDSFIFHSAQLVMKCVNQSIGLTFYFVFSLKICKIVSFTIV